MKFFNKKSFREVFSFNFGLARLFGFFYFSPKSNQVDVKSKSCGQSFQLVKFIFYAIFGLLASIKSSRVNTGNGSGSVVVTLGIELILQATIFKPTIFRVLNFCVRDQHEKIFEKFHSVDDELRRFGIKINHRKHFVIALMFTTVFYAILIVTLCVDDFLSSKFLTFRIQDRIGALLGAFNIVAILSYQICHVLIIHATFKRLQYMNWILKWSVLDRLTLRRLGRVHNMLCDTLHLINSCFAINFLDFFTEFVIFNTFFLFEFYFLLTSTHKTVHELAFNVIAAFYTFFFACLAASIILVSSWVKTEGEKTKSLIHLRTSRQSKVLKFYNQFSLQVDHQRPVVSCGVFEVDLTFLFSVLSGLFSYLIILIQFESG